MRKIFITTVILLILTSSFTDLMACSSIFLQTLNQIIYGRNHDYYNPNSVIIYNPKNLLKLGVPFPGENIAGWKSIYSSITISSISVGYANSGMNEKGLAIGHMGLPETVYPEKDDRPTILPTQWIQYMLDKCANTAEVIEEAKKIRISKRINSGNHYFVCDAKGNVATFEFLNGELIIHTNKDMPYLLLSNDTYEKSMNDIKNYTGFGGNKIIPERANYVEEVMAIGCTKMNQFYKKDKKDIVPDAFDMLYCMRAPDSTPQYKEYGTQYSTVFDITNMKLYFRTKTNQTIREIDFKSFTGDCTIKAKLLDIQTPGTGLVNNLFVDYSVQENYKFITNFFAKELYNKPSTADLEYMQFYPELFECEK